MKLKHLHIIGIGILLCGLLGFASCTNESFGPLPEEEEEDNDIYLTFHIAVAGASTRADGTPKVSDEVIKQLLVVIVSEEKVEADGTNSQTGAGGTTGTDEQSGTDGSGVSPAASKRWVIERSRLITNASIGILLYDGYTFKVKPGCRKKIYLIANHQGLTDYETGQPLYFGDSSFLPDKDGKVPVEHFVFALKGTGTTGGTDNTDGTDNTAGTGTDGTTGTGTTDYEYNLKTYGIPMTAMYEFTVPDRKDLSGDTDEYELGKLYVVRAATKYSFSFKNTSAQREIKVTGVDIEKVITDRMFLMPHVNKAADPDDANKEKKYWVVSPNETTGKRYLSATGESSEESNSNLWSFVDREWIDWMVKEAEKTQKPVTQPKDYEWLTDYNVPKPKTSGSGEGASGSGEGTPGSGEGTSNEGTCSYRMNFTTPVTVPAKVASTKPTPVTATQSFYLPESRSQKNTDDPFGLQEYKLTIHTCETFIGSGTVSAYGRSETVPNGGDGVTRSYTHILPHLASLFRNTHVKVSITFNDYELDWQVDVEPYWEVVLKPEFGLDDPDKKTETSGGDSGQTGGDSE